MNVVINACFGGYSVSLAAARRMAELGHEEAVEELRVFDERSAVFAETGINPQFGEPGSYSDYFRTRAPEWYGYISQGEGRAHPALVQTVKEMGTAAGGPCADLRVVEVPDDASWHIEEYDGNEHVAEDHRTWR